MANRKVQLEAAIRDLERARELSDYEAVDVTWVAVVKLANLFPGDSENKRLLALLACLPEGEVRSLLADQAVDALLDLDPPLESILSSRHEWLNVDRTTRELHVVRELRSADPKAALPALAQVLKRVRNRRAHGFKTPDGSRDQEILAAAVHILRAIGETSVPVVSI